MQCDRMLGAHCRTIDTEKTERFGWSLFVIDQPNIVVK